MAVRGEAHPLRVRLDGRLNTADMTVAAPGGTPAPPMKKASLGTLFLTVFLDMLAFGLVVPFLPAVARAYGAPDAVATLTGTAFSLMQFLFVPLWGRLSDRVGRRPVLLWSVSAAAIGQLLLAISWNLPTLFAARLWSGAA